MWLTLAILSMAIASVALFAASAVVWFPIWRKNESGTAHALFLTNVAMAIAIAFRVARMASTILGDGECEHTFSLIAGFLVFLASIFQFALSRGYFNSRGENDVGS